MADPEESVGESVEPAVAPEAPPIVHTPPTREYHRGHRRRLKRRHRAVRAAAETPITATPVEKPVSKRDGDEARRSFLAAQDEYLDLVGDESDEASRLRTQYKRMVRKATHLQRCGPDCVQVEIEVPAAASNPHGHDYFRLGTKTYPPGRYTVYACEARELAYLIDQNRRVDDSRLREHTRVTTAGSIRAQQIRAEN